MWSAGVRGPLLAEGLGERSAETLVVGLQVTDALRGDLDAAEQGGVGGALALGDRAAGGRARAVAKARCLGPEVGLAVDP